MAGRTVGEELCVNTGLAARIRDRRRVGRQLVDAAGHLLQRIHVASGGLRG